MANEGKWEKRWHPLREEWVVYAAHRNSRPWTMGKNEGMKSDAPEYVEDCYLCPGNPRIHGDNNPDYKDVYLFNNDHPVVGMDAPEIPEDQQTGLYRKASAKGIAKVVCYDPRHNVTLSEMPTENVAKVFDVWQQEMKDLKANPDIKFVLIFENKGKEVGVSNPHPHCQIYATDFVFTYVEKYIQVADKYKAQNGGNIFADIIAEEQKAGIRVIAENDHAIAFIPFFARYAYDVMIFPKKRHATLITMSQEEVAGIAEVFQMVTRKFDMNYQTSFPYVMSMMQAPVDGGEYPEYHFHLHLQPPLRQPGLNKFLAGPEIGGGNFMADTMPEDKAAELNRVDLSQYKA